MTIEKGRAWGEPAADLGSIPVAADDAELAAMAATALNDGRHLTAGVAAGDLLQTLGMSSRRATDDLIAYPMDLGMVRLEGCTAPARAGRPAERSRDRLPFVAHATAQRRDLLGRLLGHGPAITVAVMNAAWYGSLRLGPRAHPNDGLLDITTGRVPFRHRREAAHRARSGSHLPHPDLKVSRTRSWEINFAQPESIWLDGVDRGRASRLGVELIADAFTVVA